MSKRNRGRPKGSTKSFLTDPDRFVVSMIDGLEAVNPQLKFEHIAMFAIYFHHDLQIEMGPNPLLYVRRLKLSKEVREKLCDGYHIQRWGQISTLIMLTRLGIELILFVERLSGLALTQRPRGGVTICACFGRFYLVLRMPS
jgi:hypothetical protein